MITVFSISFYLNIFLVMNFLGTMLLCWISHICTWACLWWVCGEGQGSCIETCCWWSIQERCWTGPAGTFL